MSAEFIKNKGFTKIYEFDIIRIIAAISIILFHINEFFYPIGSIFHSFGSCGLVIFFILSGFFISKNPLDNRHHIIQFWADRLKRLFPGMYIAIILYIIVVGILGLGSPKFVDTPINVWSILVNLFGIQIYFYPLRFFALWYVSAILTYYLVHIFIKRISGENLDKYMLISFLVFLLIGLLSRIHLPLYGFGIDEDIFEYYYVFFSGVILFSVLKSKEYWTTFYPIVLIFGLLILRILSKFLGHSILPDLGLPEFLTLLGVILFLIAIKHNLYKPIREIPIIIKKCSYSTYSVYLLHYPLLCIIATLKIQNLFVFFFISIIISFTCGFILQSAMDKILYRKDLSFI